MTNDQFRVVMVVVVTLLSAVVAVWSGAGWGLFLGCTIPFVIITLVFTLLDRRE